MYIEVKFLTGEYGGKEFPPSPSRLLQAVIAGSGEKYADVLRSLETQLPVIYATRPDCVAEFSTYVINNDERLDHINAANQKRVTQTLGTLRVSYEYNVSPETFAVLSHAVDSIVALGRAGDWVLARLVNSTDIAGLDKFEPRVTGTIQLHTPVAGFVTSVLENYKNGTAKKIGRTRYSRTAGTQASRALFELTQPVPRENASHVVSWIRHAAMKRLPDKLNIDISGHGSHEQRLVITPVTTLDYNDDMIRRIIITTPDESTAQIVTAKLAGMHLTAEDGTSKGYLMPADSDAVFSQYLSASRRWMTVTPILGRFDNGDTRQRARNFKKIFEQARLPVPKNVTYIPRNDKVFVGKSHGHDKLPRMHVAVEFEEPVSGVVAVGAGRYAGLGVFANLA